MQHSATPQEATETAPRVLVVDDDADMLDMMVEALSAKGYLVDTARHGQEALERLEHRQPHLILLDMRMPVMDGWEFTREFRNKYGRSVPLVVVTAAQDSQLRANEVGADSYLGKPFDLEDLYNVVEDTVLD